MGAECDFQTFFQVRSINETDTDLHSILSCSIGGNLSSPRGRVSDRCVMDNFFDCFDGIRRSSTSPTARDCNLASLPYIAIPERAASFGSCGRLVPSCRGGAPSHSRVFYRRSGICWFNPRYSPRTDSSFVAPGHCEGDSQCSWHSDRG